MLQNIKNRKKRMMVFLLGFLSANSLIVLYNNFMPMPSAVSLQDIIAEAKQLDANLSKGELSDIGRGVLSLHRIRVSNLIIILVKAKNCSELVADDPQFLSAEYKFYKSDSSTPNLETCISPREIIPIINEMLIDDE